MTNAKRDQNRVPVLLGTSNADGVTPIPPYVDAITNRLLVDLAASGSQIASHFQHDQFTSTNNQTVFTASQTVIADFIFVVNQAVQMPTFDYNVSGNTATLTTGIPAGLQVLWIYIF